MAPTASARSPNFYARIAGFIYLFAMALGIFSQSYRLGDRTMAGGCRPAASEVPEALRTDGRRRGGCPGLHEFPEGTSHADPHDKSAREAQRRDQAQDRCRRNLPELYSRDTPRRCATARAKRRVATAATLHAA